MREDKRPTSYTLDDYEREYPANERYVAVLRQQADHENTLLDKAFVKYAGQTMTQPTVTKRLLSEDNSNASTRRANWTRLRLRQSSTDHHPFTIWALKEVTFPGKLSEDQALDFRRSAVAQEMERVMIAITGFANIGSAAGGFHYPWNTSIYQELGDAFMTYIKKHVDSITPSTPPSIQSSFTYTKRDHVRSAMATFISQLEEKKRSQIQEGQSDNVGAIVSGKALEEVVKNASSMTTGLPTSPSIMKDKIHHQS
ncbi:hypothetical protein A4X13_0g8582 [Tilletia indica]|uniref:Uncharacterized protein n=1 Tax=Tilletia indica TaxID=43049 RepID=A0A177TUA0_9BASI|nr:hypothetical protein A4X13_0g8582 [Tilletia indica]